MKAVTYNTYGGPEVVSVTEVATPEPGAHDVLIRVHAATISSGDWRARSLTLPKGFGLLGRAIFGFLKPRQPILGTELSGVVELVGDQVTRFAPGDAVFAYPSGKMGAHAEYAVMAENGLIAGKPENLSFEQAAALSFGGTTALDFLKNKGKLKAGERVLIVGASGSVGSAAVVLAKHFGAHVTGVCSAANAGLVRGLGADEVIDYARTDFANAGVRYDIILNCNGDVSFSQCEPVLNEGGRLLLVLGSFRQLMGLERPKRGSSKKLVAGVASVRSEDLEFLADLARRGVFVPLIDRSYPMENAREAHAYVGSGRKRGNVVLTMTERSAASQAA